MDGGRLRGVLRGLRRTVVSASAGGLTDADLLRCWVMGRDESAFEALLWRHAAAVLGVCLRVLRDVHEAEDAVQAAFLTLARKAGSIGRRQAVASWLYTVAYRAALQARARRVRLAASDPHDLDALPGRPAADPAWSDLRPVLDEEVNRLPEKYRSPFVLCHVEGRTNEEAARELGCPVGTVLSRLARARQRLRDRLTRRGVTLTAGAFAMGLVGEAVQAAVSGVLVRATVRAAASAAAGQGLAGAVSAKVVALTEGVIKAMLLTKLQVGFAVVLGTALLFGGGSVLTYRTLAGESAGGPKPASQAPGGRAGPTEEEKLKALLAQKDREVRELRELLEVLEAKFREKERRFEKALKEKQEQAARALDAEMLARQRAEEERDAREVAASGHAKVPPSVDTPGTTARVADLTRATQAEQAKDEVELLEAKLEAKKAHLKAAVLSMDAAKRIVKSTGFDAKIQIEIAALTGQVEVKEAELKESEVLLAQAKRRLQKIQGPAKPPQDPNVQQLDQRATDLEKKLDALQREMDRLRKDFKQQPPPQP